MTTPKLGMPELSVSQASKEITHNQALAVLDQVAQLTVISRASTPPGSPANGAAYIITATATGAWAGKETQIAYWLTAVAAWQFIVPANGWLAWSNTDAKTYRLESGAWAELAAGGGGGMTNPMTTAGDIIVGGASGTPNRLAIGTALQVLRVNSGGTGLEYATGGAGLASLVEAKTVAAPNATVPVVSLSVTISETNGDYAMVPKGTGAIVAAIPNSLASGGNKRGTRAVDLQIERSTAARVASGNNSVICGGAENTASAAKSFVGAGTGNTASGGNDVVTGGNSNTSTGGENFIGGGSSNIAAGVQNTISGGGSNSTGSGSYCTVAGGSGNTHTGSGDYRSHLGGQSNTATASHASTTGGRQNTASGQYSVTLGGYQSSTKGITGAVTHASGQFAAVGDAQAGRYTLRIATSSATPAVLTADASGTPVAANSLTLGGFNAYVIRARVIARNTSTNDCAAWEVSAIAKRGNTAADTSIVGTPTVTSLGGDASLSSASIAVSANTTLGSVAFTVTGIAATNLRWMALVETVEVG